MLIKLPYGHQLIAELALTTYLTIISFAILGLEGITAEVKARPPLPDDLRRVLFY